MKLTGEYLFCMWKRIYSLLVVAGLVLLVASNHVWNLGSDEEEQIARVIEESTKVLSLKSVSHNELTYLLRCNRTEFMVNESIDVDYVLFNNNSYPVKTVLPSSFSARGYSESEPENVIGQSVNISWVEKETIIQPKSSITLTTFMFRANTTGLYTINTGALTLELNITTPPE